MKVLIFFIAILFIGCSGEKPIHLVDKFYSYQSQIDVRQVLGKVEFKGSKEGLSTGRADYNHLSEEGKLGLLFFENQLVSIGFYPKDTISYLSKLEEIFGAVPEEKPMIYQGVMIQKTFDYEMGSIGGLFISWSDPSLKRQYEGKVW